MYNRIALVAAAAGVATIVAAAPAGASVSTGGSPTAAANATATGTVHSRSGVLGTSSHALKVNAPAAAVGFSITNVRCFSNAITFNAKTYENGRSGVQQFRQRAQLQQFTTRGWAPASRINSVKSARFPNDFRNFYFSRKWQANHVANGASWRVAWQGFYLNGFGRAIAKTKVIFVTCA